MHEELFERLLYIANQSGITITEIPGATSDPDVAFCNRKIININHNYESHISVAFHLAHEISHIQFSNPSFLYLKTKKNVKPMNELFVLLLAWFMQIHPTSIATGQILLPNLTCLAGLSHWLKI